MTSNLLNCMEPRGFDSRRLHHSIHSNQCLSDPQLRQLWLQYPSVSWDKAAFRQPPQRRIHRTRPWSARPRLRRIPGRLSTTHRHIQLAAVEQRCTHTETGCWLYPAIRDEAYPYIDLVGDDGRREQWSARRFVWALANGDIPEGGIILGKCHFKACVLPEHQELWVPPKQFDLLGADDSSAVLA